MTAIFGMAGNSINNLDGIAQGIYEPQGTDAHTLFWHRRDSRILVQMDEDHSQTTLFCQGVHLLSLSYAIISPYTLCARARLLQFRSERSLTYPIYLCPTAPLPQLS